MKWEIVIGLLIAAGIAFWWGKRFLPYGNEPKDRPLSSRGQSGHTSRGLSQWREDLHHHASGKVLVEFRYQGIDRPAENRSVQIHEIFQGNNGHFYLYGLCHNRNDMRYFREDRIIGPIRHDGDEYAPDEFLQAVYGVDSQG